MKHQLYFLWVILLACLGLVACGSDDKKEDGYDLTVQVSDGATGLWLQEADEDAATDEEADNAVSDDANVQQCAGAFGDDVEVASWKVAGSENNVTVDPVDALSLKITGNKNQFSMRVEKAPEVETASFTGVCLVLAGNQPQVTIDLVEVTMAKLKVIASGNQGAVTVNLAGTAAVTDADSNTTGNGTSVTITPAE